MKNKRRGTSNSCITFKQNNIAKKKNTLKRTESDAKGLTGSVRVVLHLVMEETKDGDEKVKENEDDKEHVATAVVYHPQVPFLAETLGLKGHLERRSGQRALQALESAPLRLIALEMGRRVPPVEIEVRVRVERCIGSTAVSKVESRGTVGHGFLRVYTKEMKGRRGDRPGSKGRAGRRGRRESGGRSKTH